MELNGSLTRDETLEISAGLSQYSGPSEPIPEKKQQQEEP